MIHTTSKQWGVYDQGPTKLQITTEHYKEWRACIFIRELHVEYLRVVRVKPLSNRVFIFQTTISFNGSVLTKKT